MCEEAGTACAQRDRDAEAERHQHGTDTNPEREARAVQQIVLFLDHTDRWGKLSLNRLGFCPEVQAEGVVAVHRNSIINTRAAFSDPLGGYSARVPLRPSHRLNLLLVPDDPERSPPDDLVERAHALAGQLVVRGGFKLLRVDLPGELVLYSNRQGGFRVQCPGCGENLVPQLGAALMELRRTGARLVPCSSCNTGHDINDLDYSPSASIARFCIELRDVGGPDLEAGHDAVEALIGPFLVVGSRG